MSAANSTQDHDDHLQQILLEFVEAEEAGQAPSRREFLARHPEFATELSEFLAGRAQVEHLAEPLRRVAGLRSGDSGPSRKGAGDAEQGQIGDFRILREVGRGGMGVVYEAEQISLRRRV